MPQVEQTVWKIPMTSIHLDHLQVEALILGTTAEITLLISSDLEQMVAHHHGLVVQITAIIREILRFLLILVGQQEMASILKMTPKSSLQIEILFLLSS